MFSALTEVLQKILTSMGTQLQEHSKYQMEQVNKLTEAVKQMTSLPYANKLPFHLIRGPHRLQWQQQVSQKIIQ